MACLFQRRLLPVTFLEGTREEQATGAWYRHVAAENAGREHIHCVLLIWSCWVFEFPTFTYFFCVTGFYSVLSHRLRCLDDERRKETDQHRFRALPDVPTATYLPVVILPWALLAYLLSTYFPLPIHLLPGCKYSYIHLPFCTCCPYLIGVYNFFWGKRPGICWWCLKQYKAGQHCCRPVFLFTILWCSHSDEHPMNINRVPRGQNCSDTPPK